MKTLQLIRKIDNKIREKSILKHPFYQDWKSGRLTRGMLREYAKQYYIHVAAFPQYLSALHSKISDQSDRKVILQNLMDEECGDKNHPALWLQFCRELGIKTKEAAETKPSASTKAFVRHFKNFTSRKGVGEGIAAMYAYESQIPEVSKEKIRGLVDFYGVKNKKGLEYFDVHIKADVEHSRDERKLLVKYAKDRETQNNVLKAVDRTLDAYWAMLSGIQKLCRSC